MAEWGVARSAAKSESQQPKTTSRGAELDGKRGCAYPSYDKIFRGIGIIWRMMALPYVSHKTALVAGGMWIFKLQYRRQCLCLLHRYWEVLDFTTQPWERWYVVLEELLACILALPLLNIDFRMSASAVVSCSDASELGGGVVVARSLST